MKYLRAQSSSAELLIKYKIFKYNRIKQKKLLRPSPKCFKQIMSRLYVNQPTNFCRVPNYLSDYDSLQTLQNSLPARAHVSPARGHAPYNVCNPRVGNDHDCEGYDQNQEQHVHLEHSAKQGLLLIIFMTPVGSSESSGDLSKFLQRDSSLQMVFL